MELIGIALIVIAVLGFIVYNKKNKKKTVQPTVTPTPVQPTPPAPLDPCRDLRDGQFNPNWGPQEALSHGYFWCSIQKATTNQSANVNVCGQQPHLVG